MKRSRKHIIFFMAGGLFIVSILYRLMNPYVQPRVDKLTYTGKVQRSENTGKVKEESGGKTTKSSDDRAMVSQFLEKKIFSGKMIKDLFSVYKPPQRVEEKDRLPETIQPAAAIEKNPSEEVTEYLTSYKFYGSYSSRGKKAVFLAKNKLVLVARTGDRLDGKYLIEDIQDNFIRVKALELNETIEIDIGEFNDD